MASSSTTYPPTPPYVMHLAAIVPNSNCATISQYAKVLLEAIVNTAGNHELHANSYHQLVVVALYHCKVPGTAHVQHEYVVAKVRNAGDPDVPIYIRFERGVHMSSTSDIDITERKAVQKAVKSNKVPRAAAQAATNAGATEVGAAKKAEVDKQYQVNSPYMHLGPSSSSNSVRTSSTSLSLPINAFLRAYDETSYSSDPPDATHIALTMDVTSLNLPLLQFTYMAYAIHMMDPVYSVLRHQCYWFCAILLTLVFESLCPDIQERVMADKHTTEAGRAALMRKDGYKEYVSFNDVGSCWQVLVTELRPAVVEDARAWVHVTWQRVEKQMNDNFKERQNKIQQVKDDAAIEVQRAKDEAQRAKDEAQREKDEAKKREDLLVKRLEEVERKLAAQAQVK
ncbi:hypothetical protein EUX98_g8827 [Antrodiella citrinella]|uniref:Uncharacterized protein n=1 Tax=Antrodiella citrinella TaxID=2447956 RepID=A0A4S4M2C3_9APHY|nr:hypothetical protein EUX98_g8827 [Antrodiella citrinella]